MLLEGARDCTGLPVHAPLAETRALATVVGRDHVGSAAERTALNAVEALFAAKFHEE